MLIERNTFTLVFINAGGSRGINKVINCIHKFINLPMSVLQGKWLELPIAKSTCMGIAEFAGLEIAGLKLDGLEIKAECS